MIKLISSLLVSLFLLSGCAGLRGTVEPDFAALEPIYPLPTLSLDDKAEKLYQDILVSHLNDEKHLLYKTQLPLEENYQVSHASADLPTWHGWWLGSLGFKLAVNGPDPEVEGLIAGGIEAIRVHFEANGIPGLLNRSYVVHCSSTPLPWMERYNKEDYPTKYWRQAEACKWVRTGVAKGHYEGTLLGLAILVGLDKRGDIQLDPHTRERLYLTVQDLVHYLVDNDYNIIDFDGERTDFGKLSDWSYNGSSGQIVTTFLRICAATGSQKCEDEFQRLSSEVTPGIRLYGKVFRFLFGYILAPSSDLYKANDTMHAGEMALAFSMVQEGTPLDLEMQEVYADLINDLETLFQYERHSFLNFVYLVVNNKTDADKIDGAVWTLRTFPDDKRQIQPLQEIESNDVQPLPNRRINSHYWKSRFTGKRRLTPDSVRTSIQHSGQDYELVYWGMRYKKYITEEQANAPVSW